MGDLTHDDLCEIAVRFLQNNGFNVAFDDRFQSSNGTGERPDAIGFRSGTSCLIEAKVSRSDFLADKKKWFRQQPEKGMGDWRFFISPPDIIKPEDLPAGWGLLHVKGKRVYKVHGWPPNTYWYDKKPFKANKQAECDHMYSALRRLQIRGHLHEIYEGIPKGSAT
ncbi:hypothetical protein ACOJ0Y_15350 [Morganella morganii]|uniref:hypothetical protein n=1 Tax=Morganella morganii TaxID=582 RepID=UPI003B671A9B